MKKLNIFFLIFASLVASCHHDHEDENLGYEQVEAPHWKVSENTTGAGQSSIQNWKVLDGTKNIHSTMTVVGLPPEVPNSVVSDQDIVAFFVSGECIGVTNPIKIESGEWRYLLNIYKPKDLNTGVTMGYYSAAAKHVFYWLDCFAYSTDAIVGNIDEPFMVPSRTSSFALEISTTIGLTPSLLEKVGAGDEMAVFCGNECRGVLTWDALQEYFVGNTGLSADTEKLVVKYYNASEKRLYTSSEFQASIYDVVIFERNIDLK